MADDPRQPPRQLARLEQTPTVANAARAALDAAGQELLAGAKRTREDVEREAKAAQKQVDDLEAELKAFEEKESLLNSLGGHKRTRSGAITENALKKALEKAAVRAAALKAEADAAREEEAAPPAAEAGAAAAAAPVEAAADMGRKCPYEVLLQNLDNLPNYNIKSELVAVSDALHDSLISGDQIEHLYDGYPPLTPGTQRQAPMNEDNLLSAISNGISERIRAGCDYQSLEAAGLVPGDQIGGPIEIEVGSEENNKSSYMLYRFWLTGVKGDNGVRQTITLRSLAQKIKQILGDKEFGFLYDATNISLDNIIVNTKQMERDEADIRESKLYFMYPREVMYDPGSKMNIKYGDIFKHAEDSQHKTIPLVEKDSSIVSYFPFNPEQKLASHLFYTKYRIDMSPISFNHERGIYSVSTSFFDENKEIYKANEMTAEANHAKSVIQAAIALGKSAEASAAAQSKRIGDEGQGLSGLRVHEREFVEYKDGVFKESPPEKICYAIPWSNDRPFLADSLLKTNVFFYLFLLDSDSSGNERNGFGALFIPKNLTEPPVENEYEKMFFKRIQENKEFPLFNETFNSPEKCRSFMRAYLSSVQNKEFSILSSNNSPFTDFNTQFIPILQKICMYYFYKSSVYTFDMPGDDVLARIYETLRKVQNGEDLDQGDFQQVKPIQKLLGILQSIQKDFVSFYESKNISQLIQEFKKELVIPRVPRSVNPLLVRASILQFYIYLREMRRSNYWEIIYPWFEMLWGAKEGDVQNLPVRYHYFIEILDEIKEDSWRTPDEKAAALNMGRSVLEHVNGMLKKEKGSTKLKGRKPRNPRNAINKGKQIEKQMKRSKDPAVRTLFNRKGIAPNVYRGKGAKVPKRGGAQTRKVGGDLSRINRVKAATRRLYSGGSRVSSDFLQRPEYQEALEDLYFTYVRQDLVEKTIPTLEEVNSKTPIDYVPNHAISLFLLYLSAIQKTKDTYVFSVEESEQKFDQTYNTLCAYEQMLLQLMFSFQKEYRALRNNSKVSYPSFALHKLVLEYISVFINLSQMEDSIFTDFPHEILDSAHKIRLDPIKYNSKHEGIQAELLKLYTDEIKKSTVDLFKESNTKSESRYERTIDFCCLVQDHMIHEWLGRHILSLPENICDWNFIKDQKTAEEVMNEGDMEFKYRRDIGKRGSLKTKEEIEEENKKEAKKIYRDEYNRELEEGLYGEKGYPEPPEGAPPQPAAAAGVVRQRQGSLNNSLSSRESGSNGAGESTNTDQERPAAPPPSNSENGTASSGSEVSTSPKEVGVPVDRLAGNAGNAVRPVPTAPRAPTDTRQQSLLSPAVSRKTLAPGAFQRRSESVEAAPAVHAPSHAPPHDLSATFPMSQQLLESNSDDGRPVGNPLLSFDPYANPPRNEEGEGEEGSRYPLSFKHFTIHLVNLTPYSRARLALIPIDQYNPDFSDLIDFLINTQAENPDTDLELDSKWLIQIQKLLSVPSFLVSYLDKEEDYTILSAKELETLKLPRESMYAENAAAAAAREASRKEREQQNEEFKKAEAENRARAAAPPAAAAENNGFIDFGGDEPGL